MRFTYEEIKKEISQNFGEIIRDDLSEWAEGFLPVYYSDILKDWSEMPSEFDNQWRDGVEITKETTLYDLMSFDLFMYYLEKANQAYEEILDEERATADN